MATNEAYDFKGNSPVVSRRLAKEYKTTLNWAQSVPLEEPVFTTRTEFDALNRPVLVTTPDRSVVRPTYDEASQLERLEASLCGSAESTVFVASLDHNARGQRTMCVYGNGVRTEYNYDPQTFRLSSLRTLRRIERLQDLNYTYDPSGNVTHIHNAAQDTLFFRNRRVEPSADYTYDAIYRLIEATGREHVGQAASNGGAPAPGKKTDAHQRHLPHPNDGSALGRYVQRYLYDQAGNLLQIRHRGTNPVAPGRTCTYHYTAPSLLEPDHVSNRLTSIRVGTDGAFQPLTYDAAGNTTSMPELPMIGWDHKNQLQHTARQVVRDGGIPQTTYYVYDAAGQRVRAVTERQATSGRSAMRKSERIYLSSYEVFREYTATGEIATAMETLHLIDGQQRIALVETRTGGTDSGTGGTDSGPAQLQRYQFADHLGSAMIELDRQANIISYEEYYPYGGTAYLGGRTVTEVNPKRYRYTGRERDEETGFTYYGSRYYSTRFGRWVSADPIGIAGGLNLYEYCKSNPVTFSDTTGTERNIADINQAFDTNSGIRFSGDHVITLHELAEGLNCTTLSLPQWAEMMREDSGGYQVDDAVASIIASFAPPTLDPATANEPNENTPWMNEDGEIYTIKEGLATTQRELHKYSDPKRLIVTAEVGAAVLAPEYYFTARSIYHSATGHPGQAAIDLSGVLAGRALEMAMGSTEAPSVPVPPRNPVQGLTEDEIDATVSDIRAGQYYRTPVEVSEQPGRTSLDDLTPVSRWGRPGLQPGDWVMPGDPTKTNYRLSFKWEPNWSPRSSWSNQPAAPETGQAFMVPKLSVRWPSGWQVWKGIFTQRQYRP